MTKQTEAQRLIAILENRRMDDEQEAKHDIEAAKELRRLEVANAELLEALLTAYTQATKHDERLPFDWALYCEALHMAIKKHGGAA